MKQLLKILHLEDEPNDAELIRTILNREDIQCESIRVETKSDFVAAVEQGGFGLILADHSLPGFDGMSALAIAREKCPEVPFILISGVLGEEVAIESLKQGATDYVLKQLMTRLMPAVQRALNEAKLLAERKLLQQKFEESRILEHHLAYHDILTGLPNRQLFFDNMQQSVALASRYQQLLAVLFLDLDNLKDINDTFSHSAGDFVLKSVAQRLISCIRKSDIVARIGGDEFAIALVNIVHHGDAVRISQKILEKIANPILLDDQEILISASIGIGLYPADGNDIETLLKNADIGMYRAKKKV